MYKTIVIFVDLSEEGDEKTISYSAELFDQIASKF
jgi:outer membrane protein assembly factor BamC